MPALAKWVANGGEAWQLIEPVDGFHPNQYAMALETVELVEWELQYAPGVYGIQNPNNDIISVQFGDQGGY